MKGLLFVKSGWFNPNSAMDFVMRVEIANTEGARARFSHVGIASLFLIRKSSKCLLWKRFQVVIDFYCGFWI